MPSDVKFSNPCLYEDNTKNDFPDAFLRFQLLETHYTPLGIKNGECRFTFKLHMKCKPILDFILSGQAEVRLKIYANRTKHRVIIPLIWDPEKTQLSEDEFVAIGTVKDEVKDLYGPFSITGLIVMVKPATLNYLIDDEIIPIELMPSQIVGFSEIASGCEIPREEISVHNGSIFYLQKDSKLNPGQFQCSLTDEDKLTIRVAEDSFRLVKTMMGRHLDLFKATVLSNVMVSLLSQLYVENSNDSPNSYQTCSWYVALNRDLNAVGIDLSSMTEDNLENVVLHVNTLLNTPLTIFGGFIYDNE